MAAVFVARPLARLRADAPQSAALTREQLTTLGAIGEVVLPTSLGRAGRDAVVSKFAAWVRDYREGADMGHGYGSSTLRSPSGPSPAARYPAQFAALDDAARAQGAASFAALRLDARRTIIEAALNQPQPVNRLPSQPTGASLIADFMGSYFTSEEAWDRCYDAAIRRDTCRTLDGSERPPAAIRGR
jgi:hypothetical protein